MNFIKEYGKIAAVGLDLQKCPSFFHKLKNHMRIDEAKTSFEFLNKLEATLKIYIHPDNPRYENLKDAIRGLVETGLPENECETASKIMNKLGFQMPEYHPSGPSPMVIGEEEIRPKNTRKTFEKDSSVEVLEASTEDISGHAIISRFDIDLLRGITWPDIWYEEFYLQTEKIFGSKIKEISAENSTDFTMKVNDTASKINPKVPIYIIIFGFSPCFSDDEPFSPGHFIIPVASSLREIYSMENFYEIKGLENKKKILILFTLPSPKLQFKNTTVGSYKFNVNCRMAPKTIFFQCPISCTSIWEEIVSAQKLEVFLTRLQDKKYFSGKKHLFYYNNLDSIKYRTEETDAMSLSLGNKYKPNYGQGMAFNLSFGDPNSTLDGILPIFKKRFCANRDWKLIEDRNKISAVNFVKQNDPILKEQIGNMRTEINEEVGINCIFIFIYQYGSWETKDNSINSYVDIVRTVSQELDTLDLTKIFMNLNTKGRDPLWTYDKEDAKKIERGINHTKDTIFILSDRDFVLQFSLLLDFKRDQSMQFSHSLRETVEKTISINEKLSVNKFEFAQVLSSPDCEDFVFPPPIYI